MREGEKAGWQRRESGVLLWPVQRCERTINSARWGLRTIRRCLNLEGAAGLCEVGGCACLVALYFQVQFCWLSSSSSSSSSSPLSMSMCKVVEWNTVGDEKYESPNKYRSRVSVDDRHVPAPEAAETPLCLFIVLQPYIMFSSTVHPRSTCFPCVTDTSIILSNYFSNFCIFIASLWHATSPLRRGLST